MAATADETNFTRLTLIIVDVCSEVYRDLLESEIQPALLQHRVSLLSETIKKKLAVCQHNEIASASTSQTYDGLDISISYFLLRNFWPSKPNQGWNCQAVHNQNVTVADDIQRIHIFRNKMFAHACKPSISPNEYQTFFLDIQAVFLRLDNYQDKNGHPIYRTVRYHDRLQLIQRKQLDAAAHAYYTKQLKMLQANEAALKAALDVRIQAVESGVQQNLQDIGAIKSDVHVVDARLKSIEAGFETHLRRLEGTRYYEIAKSLEEYANTIVKSLDDQAHFALTAAFQISSHGGYGKTYLGYSKIKGFVAVKQFVKGDKSIQYDRELRNTINENAVKNIVNYYFFDDSHEHFNYIVMELCKCDIATYLDANPQLGLKERLIMLKDFTTALDGLHKINIVHRDVKPENVLIDLNDKIKVTDFGISRKSDGNTTTINTTGGGLRWMNPNSIGTRRQTPCKRDDVFSVLLVGYYLLSGKHPFLSDEDGIGVHQDRVDKLSLRESGIDIHIKDCFKSLFRDWNSNVNMDVQYIIQKIEECSLPNDLHNPSSSSNINEPTDSKRCVLS